MGRWTQYDEDDHRLPEGMKRVGYDADTQQYTFKDQDGSLWVGREGQEFGEMTKVSEGHTDSADLEASGPSRADGYGPLATEEGQLPPDSLSRSSYRTLLPFFLIICAFLLLVIRLSSPSLAKPWPACPEHSRPYEVKSGDTCWAITTPSGGSVDNLRRLNPGLDCAALMPGQRICVPTKA
ncbi:carbohydrate-binding module family 50 protein [Botryobasidium botryosum FD-172 SS1]|uniref:Carbohydrate-binding module family 50 protein n=1 Tax=Botryobasidium botryosum (strain FD-172 SS1) TaxID=930990 RepID=A0A067LUR9_BOTB1|nr:carbohydrate-binding module family 50 protein [Botryobasidium botryosum FD-172 SS1]